MNNSQRYIELNNLALKQGEDWSNPQWEAHHFTTGLVEELIRIEFFDLQTISEEDSCVHQYDPFSEDIEILVSLLKDL